MRETSPLDQFGLNIAWLSYGATCRFYSAERRSEGLSQANFAENEAWTLRKGVMGNRILLEGRFSNFS